MVYFVFIYFFIVEFWKLSLLDKFIYILLLWFLYYLCFANPRQPPTSRALGLGPLTAPT